MKERIKAPKDYRIKKNRINLKHTIFCLPIVERINKNIYNKEQQRHGKVRNPDSGIPKTFSALRFFHFVARKWMIHKSSSGRQDQQKNDDDLFR